MNLIPQPVSYKAPDGVTDVAVSAANPLPTSSTGGGGTGQTTVLPGGTGQSATMLSAASGAGTTGTDITWSGGDGLIDVDGTFNGTTVVAQYKSKASGNWNAMAGPSGLAVAGSFIFNYPPNYHIRLLLSGGTPTAMNATVQAA